MRVRAGWRAALVTWVVGLLGWLDVAAGDQPAGTISFNRDIRPILSENCYKCHGPDRAARQGNLRFDQESSAKSVAESGKTAIVAGRRAESELLARINSSDAEQLMPPTDSGKTLTSREKELLARWIDEGAVWEGHWSLLPVRPSALDGGANGSFIDHWIDAGLQKAGLTPAEPADGVTLARRLSFDLTGLAPDADDVAMLSSGDASAYERVVNRYLQSPHFGERLAMMWLDLVRYADSVGYHGDQPISISPYRDYVIASFNQNKPFDQFTIEQLAGDLLVHPTTDQQIASGYHRLGMMSAEGGIQDKEYRAKYAAERVRNLGGTWLGMTLGCCECHDHKYDPFTTREFYSLEAFFADITEFGFYGLADPQEKWGPWMPVPTLEQQMELSRLEGTLQLLETTLKTSTAALDAEQAVWEKSVSGTAEWVAVRPITLAAEKGTTLKLQEDLSILASGTSPDTETYTLTARLPIQGVTAVRIEAMSDDSLPAKGPGRADNGNFVLSEVTLVYRSEPAGKAQPLVLDRASASHEQATLAESNPYKIWSAGSAIDGDEKGPTWGWAVLPEVGTRQEAVFETVLDVHSSADSIVTIKLAQNLDNPRHTLGRFRLSVTNSPRPVRAAGAGLPAEIRGILATAADQRTPEQKTNLSAYFRSVAPSLAWARQQKADGEAKRRQLMSQVRTTLITKPTEPRTIRVLARGNWMDDTGEIVLPAMPAAISWKGENGDESKSSAEAGRASRLNRLDLARWLVDGRNPLTARVFVNRLWKIYFGQGISRKLDDLGSQGDWPSHPELLDQLAGEFVRSGWDIKHLVKLMVMSKAYRRSSVPSAEAFEKDPFNRWLGRQGRYRQDAELIRDQSLQAAGLLNEAIGGPSVFPYQPAGYWSFLNFPVREWKNSTGRDLYRRGLYTHWQRQYLHPSLLAFDAPSREECTAERVRSNTPLQSLVLLNDPTFVEAARGLSDQLLLQPDRTDHERLDELFRRALSRGIRPEEERVLHSLLEKHRAEFGTDAASAKAVVGVGQAKAETGLGASSSRPAAVSDAERAAWTSVARAVLNLHSFVTRN
jgi:hypothetical protein